MKLELNTHQITDKISHFMHRYHVLLFSLLALGGLSTATYLLYSLATSAQDVQSTSSGANFDKATIEKINNLRSSSDSGTPLTLPAGRTNPFQE